MNLSKIVSSVQNISEAISSVLKIDVTVVDDCLNRIAGTGRYKQCIGEPVSKNSVFSFALCKGESFIIENPGEHTVCLKCEALKTCSERAEVCCPIKVGNRAIGAIGLIAFEEEQRNAIINDKENLIGFLNRMADLISSKLLEQENTDKIKLLVKNLETVIDSVDKGIISVDTEGRVSSFNKKALELFHINEDEILNMNIKAFIENINLNTLMGHTNGVKKQTIHL
ncbi:PAS domain-containing protein [Oceanirhabdus sp. W0125-5]|uniref:PAS domain-containing protein n=1 Tax=Oceanirhabdus sp. W0125-5 TaxID=2999116 RepID=UPI0022F33C64|nr:PAS domain-containing protein [Oceanirhabdus sp. W0125-5]WBW96719.1 PAS domain-containing protein [Oceanirhabdus sp. W0125-5]